MPDRRSQTAVLLTLALSTIVSAACGQAETSNRAVTTTSPAGESTAPSPAVAERRDEALVRVVHAMPAGGPLDLFAGDMVVFENLVYKSVTPYRVLDGKRYAFSLRPTGAAAAKPLASNTERMDEGDYYTVFALPGEGRSAYLRIVDDRLTTPATGKARLRVVHGGADVREIDIHVADRGESVFDGVDFQTVTGYEDIDPFNSALEIRNEGETAALATITNAQVESGRFYTLVVVGSAGSTPRLEAFLIEDEVGRPPTTAR
jgi:hypothetical protein